MYLLVLITLPWDTFSPQTASWKGLIPTLQHSSLWKNSPYHVIKWWGGPLSSYCSHLTEERVEGSSSGRWCLTPVPCGTWTGRHLPTNFKWQPAKFSWDHKGSASLKLSTAVATGRLRTEATERLARQSQSHGFLFWFVSGFWSQLCLRPCLRFWSQAWILSNFASYKAL